MGDVTVNEAIEKVRSERLKERNEGLVDLKHILTQGRRGERLDALNDKGYHKIYEALFRLATSDKSAYGKATKSSLRAQVGTRLASCAAVFRLAVEAGVRKLKQKTVKALVDHITQTLPTSEGGFCEPLGLDYIKSLRVLVEYQPHVEHFVAEEWHNLITFCLDGIQIQQGVLGDNASSVSDGPSGLLGSASTNGSSSISTSLRFANASTTFTSHGKTNAEELILCLDQLLRPGRAPDLKTTRSILATLIQFLQLAATVGRAHHTVLSAFNQCFVHTSTDHIDLSRQAIGEILPLLRRLWGTKSSTLKDEMLTTLIHAQTYLEKMIQDTSDPTIYTELESLLELMQTDYSKRLDREQLQLDDVDLAVSRPPPTRHHPLRLRVMSLKGSPRSEQSWTMLQMIAVIISILDSRLANVPENAAPTKRRRLNQFFEDCLRQAKLSGSASRLCALQALPFVLDHRPLPEVLLETVLEQLVSSVSDDDSQIASWSMIAITSCAFQATARSASLSSQWPRIWNLASRSATSPSTSRAACHFMEISIKLDLVPYNSIADVVETLFSSIELNGPSVLTDSALLFWVALSDLRKSEAPGLSATTSDRLAHWLVSRWTPAKLTDRHVASQYAQHAQPAAVLDILSACAGYERNPITAEAAASYSSLAQAWESYSQVKTLTRYLLLVDDLDTSARWLTLDTLTDMQSYSENNKSLGRTESLVFEYCATEFDRALQAWTIQLSERAQYINSDMVRVLTSFCIIGHQLVSVSTHGETHRVAELGRISTSLLEALASFVARPDCEQVLVDAVLETIYPFLPALPGQGGLFSTSTWSCLQSVFSKLASSLEKRRRAEEDLQQDPLESMDLDDGFESQGSSLRFHSTNLDYPRHDIPARASIETFRHSVSASLHLLSNVQDGRVDPSSTRAFVDHLLSLKHHEFLACRQLLGDATEGGAVFDRSTADRLLVHLGQEYLGQYEFDRCEVSMMLCLDALTGLADVWARDGSDDLSETSSSLYEWFIDVVLDKGLAPSSVQIKIANLLQRLLRVEPEYAKRYASLSSVRTSLLKVLQDGNMPVKFSVAEHIADVFGLYVLNRHDAVFEDVLSSLPRDADWMAGIALRLLVLARLASSWYTLLRRSVYHIFETPGLIPDAAGHATRCLSELSTRLHLASSRDLLHQFLPQIIYTWLETQPLHAAPFSIFGYDTLLDFLKVIQNEATGQLVMRANEEQLGALAESLGVSPEDLVIRSFDRVMAYSIARDFSVPPPTGSTQHVTGEARVRKLLGKETFLSELQRNFAQIIAIFFDCLEQEDQMERAFAKRPQYQYAAGVLREIKAFGSSSNHLPVNQQPSFRAKYLIDEIHYVCHRMKYDVTQIWTPSLLTFILRRLLDSIHPALGSLHACSVVRRIRILVSVAGDPALCDYPLELLLHSLRPFLTDSQCAEDTIGLMQYLLKAGRAHLCQVPSFLAGISLSILASLRSFLDSSQDSTSLESQHRATLSRAQSFHDWLSTFLASYDSPHLSGDAENAFRAILRAACKMKVGGGAMIGTDEGVLLKELLDNDRSKRKLLNQPSQDLAFSLICQDFRFPASFQEDIFGTDSVSLENAVAVWRSCQRTSVGKSYLAWAGHVLGRAYASSGQVAKEMLSESGFAPIEDVSDGAFGQGSGSRSNILRLLRDLLSSDSRVEVGLAESTLQLICSRLIEPDELAMCEQVLPPSLLVSFKWNNFYPPETGLCFPSSRSMRDVSRYQKNVDKDEWIRNLCVALAHAASEDAILGALSPVMSDFPRLSEQLFPYILHLALLKDFGGQQNLRSDISATFREWFQAREMSAGAPIKMLIMGLLHLRKQPLPRETSRADREQWLDIDYGEAAQAAVLCQMFRTGLFFVEIQFSQAMRASRRSSSQKIQEPTELLLTIYRNIEDPDSFYGVQQQSSLSAISDRLEFERDGPKSLSFRGAQYDSQLRHSDGQGRADYRGLVNAFSNLELNGLSMSLLQDQRARLSDIDGARDMYRSARKLEQWDLPSPASHKGEEAMIYRSFQYMNNSVDHHALKMKLRHGIADIMTQMTGKDQTESSMRSMLRGLAVLTEADEVLASVNAEQLGETWDRLRSRLHWMHIGRFEDVDPILSARETLFSSLSQRPHLQEMVKSSSRDTRTIEVHALLDSSRISRKHGALQSSLTAATYLTQLVAPCDRVGINITAITQTELANVLWDQGEMTASIRVLQEMNSSLDLRNQSVRIGKPELLAKLGHRMSEARLEKPDEIISRYLIPAIKELKGASQGDEAGQVFHEFASFCDQQLQDADNLEDYRRISRLRERKGLEVQQLEHMYKGAPSQSKPNLQGFRNRARQWYDLDDREYQRLHEGRQAFLRQSLENYLLSLKACENYNNDALRFCALWLEQSEQHQANKAVSRYLSQVPSRKFATLINQLSSRLLDTTDPFQSLLFPLVSRICVDHPYHGMYQIFSISKSKGKDAMAISRHGAAVKMVSILKEHETASGYWLSIQHTSICYARLAGEKLEEKGKAGSRIALRRTQAGQRLENDVVACKIPPPTMKVELRADGDYSAVPTVVKFHPDFTVAGGVSAPKIVTAVASNGVKYKQLVKGGNDDLRQDAIMEQVFERVSQLLHNDRSTRQRDLAIRTYKVLPLTTSAGIIEFVPNTLPLHDFLMPAHQKHFPKDWKPQMCRKTINDVQSKPVEVRLRAYRQVAEHFHPVMRYFFMERFDSPDEWFRKRLAYIRSTAAISILGHVLGLGDRHGHNILLDEGTGEVVHIDLGVAFEQGRVLPVPEVVPFRLTRDVVDGMGITKTEGAFRRCCEFTLDALRKEAYSIMTILDVLRYDPLYNWTLNPLRVKRQLEQPEDESEPSTRNEAEAAAAAAASRKRENNEPSEADRALTVVAKKLSKTLSVTATVNELIQQATDERNLAVLYCGWAAYA